MERTCRRCASGAAPVTGNNGKKQSKSATGVTILILVLVAITGGLVFYGVTSSHGGTKLEYKFEPGQVDKYRFNADITIDNPTPLLGRGGSMTINVQGNTVRRTLDVFPNGSAKLEEKLSDVKLSCPSMPLDMLGDGIPDQTIVYTLSKDGQMAKNEEPEDSDDWQPSLFTSGIDPESLTQGFKPMSLPKKGINEGDTWTEYMELPDGSLKFKVTCTLVSSREKLGTRDVCKIEEKYGQTAGEDNSKKGALADVTVSGTGTTYFCTEEGKVIKSESNLQVNKNLKLSKQLSSAGFPSEIKTTMTVKALQELVE